LTGCLSTASFTADLHHGGVYLGGRLGPAHIGTATKPIGKNAACSAPKPPLRDGAAVRWSRLEIAINVVSVICSSKPREPLVRLSQRKTAAVRSDGL